MTFKLKDQSRDVELIFEKAIESLSKEDRTELLYLFELYSGIDYTCNCKTSADYLVERLIKVLEGVTK